MVLFLRSTLHVLFCMVPALGSPEIAPDDVSTCPDGAAHGASQLQLSSGVLEVQDEIQKGQGNTKDARKRSQRAHLTLGKQAKIQEGAVGLHNSTGGQSEAICRAQCDAMTQALQRSRRGLRANASTANADYQTYGPGQRPCDADGGEGTALNVHTDSSMIFTDLQGCKEACDQDSRCNAFSWNSADEKCYLKDKGEIDCSAAPCPWDRWDDKDGEWNYYYDANSCAPAPTPAPSGGEEESESEGCEHFCKDVGCPCLVDWEDRCQVKSCAGCPECVVALGFSVPADYEFDVVCPGQAPVAPNLATGHLSVGENKLDAGGCGNDGAKDLVIEYKNTCPGKGTLLVNSCYEETSYDVVIALYTKQDGVKECNDDVGAPNFCHTIEAGVDDNGATLIPARYLVNGKYVACPGDGASQASYGDSTGGIRCAAMGYDMEPGEVARVIVTSYSTDEGNFKLTNRLHDVD